MALSAALRTLSRGKNTRPVMRAPATALGICDTGADWAAAILPADRPTILTTLDEAQEAANDEETCNNLSFFGALLTKAK